MTIFSQQCVMRWTDARSPVEQYQALLTLVGRVGMLFSGARL